MKFLFGEGQYGYVFLIAGFLVLALIGFFAWLVRLFRSERTEAASRRARQPRLAVIDAATVDGRRRLVIIRHDNVEHLLMIGGPTDIVVGPNIVRATAREPAHARPPAFAEATQHPATQLEPAPGAFTRLRPPMADQHTQAEPPVPRSVDRLVSNQPVRERQLPGAAAEAVITPTAEHNSAEAAQRLVEAVLLRSRQPRFSLTPSSKGDAERESVGAARLAGGEAKLEP
jgi:flagellar biogenesis protein FliO